MATCVRGTWLEDHFRHWRAPSRQCSGQSGKVTTPNDCGMPAATTPGGFAEEVREEEELCLQRLPAVQSGGQGARRKSRLRASPSHEVWLRALMQDGHPP